MKAQGKYMVTRIAISFFLCGVIVFWGFQVFGEEWTTEQK